MNRLERWESIWGLLTTWRRVTAMDRRGRGSSGDAQPYRLSKEFDDVAAGAADRRGPAARARRRHYYIAGGCGWAASDE